MQEKFGIKTKELMSGEFKEKLENFHDFIITNYKNLSSQDIEKLRKNMRKAESNYFVVKNSIAKRVFGELDIEGLDEFMKGQVGIGFCGDIVTASKTLVDFSKEHADFTLACAFLEGKVQESGKIKEIAALPSREVLLAMVVSYMKSPINGFVGVLKGLLRNLVHAINEIKKKREGGEVK